MLLHVGNCAVWAPGLFTYTTCKQVENIQHQSFCLLRFVFLIFQYCYITSDINIFVLPSTVKYVCECCCWHNYFIWAGMTWNKFNLVRRSIYLMISLNKNWQCLPSPAFWLVTVMTLKQTNLNNTEPALDVTTAGIYRLHKELASSGPHAVSLLLHHHKWLKETSKHISAVPL